MSEVSDEVLYYKLTDRQHKGEILKRIGFDFYGYVDGEWEIRGINIGYFYPDAPEFDCYEIISEEEAFKILKIS